MSQMLLDHFQRQVVHGVSLLAAVLLTGSVLFGQQTNPSARPRGWDQGQPAHPFSDWNDTPMASTEPQPPCPASKFVTVQELNHNVPKKARKEVEKAERAHAKNQIGEAIVHFKQAILIDPIFVAARNNLAAIYLRAANPEPAIAQLEEAVKIDPHHPILFKNLTVGYIMIHNFEAAERVARVTLGLDRTGSRAPMLLGFVLVNRQKFNEEALQCFERAHDEYPLAHLLAGRVLIAQGNSEKAKSEIQTYLSSGEQTFRVTATNWLDVINQSEQRSAAVLPH